MTTDLTPARCGSSAVHPPHPIDGSAPGVADCEGQPRRATDREITQARAFAENEVGWTPGDDGLGAPTQAQIDEWERNVQHEYEGALAVLIHANGGRYAEPIDWDKVLRERDSLARRCAARFEEAEKLRAEVAELRRTIRNLNGGRYAEPDDERPDWHPAKPGDTPGQLEPQLHDPRVVVVLNAAIAWRRLLDVHADDLDAEEHDLVTALDAMLSARRSDGDGQESGALPSPEPERAGSVPQPTPDGPARPGEPEPGALAHVCDMILEQLHVAEAICRHGSGPGPVGTVDACGMCVVQAVSALPVFEPVLFPARTVSPVTPAADLADEATHERVARAIHNGRFPKNADEVWANPKAREDAYMLAKAAIDAYRAGPAGDDTLRAAWIAIQRLATGLTRLGVHDFGGQPLDVVERALARIDGLQTALDEAARDAHETVELAAVYDDGLSTDQEIRARTLDAAVRLSDNVTPPEGANDPDIREWALDTASEFAAFIGDGTTRDADDPWLASRPPRCTCKTPGEHPHAADGCGASGCGCTWTPLAGSFAYNDTDEPARRPVLDGDGAASIDQPGSPT